MMFFYAIVILTAYLVICTFLDYIMEKREKEISDCILHQSFKHRK